MASGAIDKMNGVKPSCKIDPEHLIMNPARTMGLTTKGRVTMVGYKLYDWWEFKELYELQMMDRKPNFVFSMVKDAKKVVEGLGEVWKSCEFLYAKDCPLIIDAGDFVIAIAAKVDVE